MLDLAERRRALQAPKLLGEIVGETKDLLKNDRRATSKNLLVQFSGNR